ncbi:dynactin subunit 2 [Trichogramma pretiosum]|uniref:dynactin subunit 2 n=1 Tax=Trichogramma pretiosum TaxID=7493 RepID=UPI0006C96EAB|nr:dynactin subunit 2 [Trichogramma pretiosum]
MIDPKYAELPGIARDQPDVYETEDPQPNEPLQEYAGDESDAIEKIYVNANDSYNKFKDKRVSSHDADFSDTITMKAKLGYKVHSGEWKLSGRGEDETPIEKYQRIKIEIQELLEQINKIKEYTKGKEEPKSLADIINQIENTGKELDSLDIEKILGKDSISAMSNHQELRFKELKAQIELFKQQNASSAATQKETNKGNQEVAKGTLKYQMTYFPDKAKVQDVARISHLEKRLGHLESLIGQPTDSTSKTSQLLKTQGIQKSIEKLMANACLLNSSQLDILENKMSTLLHKMDTVIQKKEQAGEDNKYEQTVSELYELVKQTESVSQVLPQTIDRLVALSGLHGKALEFVNRLKELEDLEQNIKGSLGNNQVLLQEMQKNFSNNFEIITNDISALNERVKKLKK